LLETGRIRIDHLDRSQSVFVVHGAESRSHCDQIAGYSIIRSLQLRRNRRRTAGLAMNNNPERREVI
jgi:hypothetical protein